MKEQRSHLSGTEKFISILIIPLSVAVILLAMLQLLGIWEKSINVYEPLIGVILLLQARLLWKHNRKIAIFQLCAAAFVFICAIVILVIPLFS